MARGHAGGRGGAEAYGALAALTLVWGYNWVVMKVATRDASPLWLAAARSALGALALLAFQAARGRSLRPTPFLPTFVYGLLQTVAFSVLQIGALARGGTGKTAILVFTMPFWLTLLARPFLGERVGARRWLALAVAGAGLALVAGPLGGRSTAADLLAVGAGAAWALAAVHAVRLQEAGGHDLVALTAWQMVWGALVLVPLAALEHAPVRPTGTLLAAVVYMAVLSYGFGWALWLFILSRVPAAAAGLASLATPILGAAAAALQLGELPSRRELAGMICIVVALVVNARARA